MEQAIYKTGCKGLDIITSGMELYAADRALYDREDADTARVLAGVLELVRNDYDFCIIDNGPAVDTYLAQVKKDAQDSGVNGVTSTQPDDQTSGDEFLAALQSLGKKQ